MTEITFKMTIKQKKYIEKLNAIVSQKGGKCLSCIYINSVTPLEWECKRSHIWLMKPSSQRNRNSLSDVQCLAKEHSSTLSSTEYNNITPLEWECDICHNNWNSTLNAMKTRSLKEKWCLFCKEKGEKCQYK